MQHLAYLPFSPVGGALPVPAPLPTWVLRPLRTRALRQTRVAGAVNFSRPPCELQSAARSGRLGIQL